MSKFVNFKKRDVALPPGCKDLFDVLSRERDNQQRQPADNAAGEANAGYDDLEHLPTVLRESFSGWLDDGESVIRRFFESESSPAMLFVSPPAPSVDPCTETPSFHVRRSRNGSLVGTVSLDLNSDEEKAVRLFIKNNGLTDLRSFQSMKSVIRG